MANLEPSNQNIEIWMMDGWTDVWINLGCLLSPDTGTISVQISEGQNHKDSEYPGEAGRWFLTSGHRQGSVPKSPISKAPVPAQKSQSFARRRCSTLYRSIRQEKPDNLGTLPKKWLFKELLLNRNPPPPQKKVLKPTVSRELYAIFFGIIASKNEQFFSLRLI